MIGLVDYGLGNMFSLQNALRYIGAPFAVVRRPEELSACKSLILPGVGAFPEGMKRLTASGMASALKNWNGYLLGICLGMQLLFEESEEFSKTEGLSLLPGRVVPLTAAKKIPQIGWNTLTVRENPLTANLDAPCVYFVHSYKAETPAQLAYAEYGEVITAIAGAGKVFGTQFHPEKSGETGIAILKNYVKLAGENP